MARDFELIRSWLTGKRKHTGDDDEANASKRTRVDSVTSTTAAAAAPASSRPRRNVARRAPAIKREPGFSTSMRSQGHVANGGEGGNVPTAPAGGPQTNTGHAVHPTTAPAPSDAMLRLPPPGAAYGPNPLTGMIPGTRLRIRTRSDERRVDIWVTIPCHRNHHGSWYDVGEMPPGMCDYQIRGLCVTMHWCPQVLQCRVCGFRICRRCKQTINPDEWRDL
ncbi:hypothetical protein M409DRAFT_21730 [Zasmidium cellare ATCC 36951]|uniref:Uncharacterized protein n=1 Tax=Zasmidium cellare ATCC 36951 TaxID=1080233 RepID=A0A6A6CNS1_ZASCE|nr:uncharacterized protein M409DRAFT_21730 [Zasmidium cellare ATCC 36951]KAF2168293.1 hypothetical protein M409DRAFT_21730 [Zasmidium cellare ATCC 36951]